MEQNVVTGKEPIREPIRRSTTLNKSEAIVVAKQANNDTAQQWRNSLLILLCSIVLLLIVSPAVFAQTAAGTIITNTATANFMVGTTARTVTAEVDFQVQEVINIVTTWQDGSNILVETPSTDQVSSFTVTNTGNGEETVSLAVDNVASPTDDFDITIATDVVIYIEDGTTPGFQIGEDILYDGTNDPTLAAGTGVDVYVLADIPAAQVDASELHLELVAASTTAGAAGAAPGTELVGLGDGGVNAIVGTSQADGNDTAIYQVESVIVNLSKVILSVVDEFGTDQFLPNSTVTYRITVEVVGGVAEDLVISDPIPANTSYELNSLLLDGAALTDAADADRGDYNETTPGAITVNFGDTNGGNTFEIDLTVTIL